MECVPPALALSGMLKVNVPASLELTEADLLGLYEYVAGAVSDKGIDSSSILTTMPVLKTEPSVVKASRTEDVSDTYRVVFKLNVPASPNNRTPAALKTVNQSQHASVLKASYENANLFPVPPLTQKLQAALLRYCPPIVLVRKVTLLPENGSVIVVPLEAHISYELCKTTEEVGNDEADDVEEALEVVVGGYMRSYNIIERLTASDEITQPDVNFNQHSPHTEVCTKGESNAIELHGLVTTIRPHNGFIKQLI